MNNVNNIVYLVRLVKDSGESERVDRETDCTIFEFPVEDAVIKGAGETTDEPIVGTEEDDAVA